MRKEIMLCSQWNAKRLQRWPTPWIVQPKINGRRCLAYCDTGGVVLKSSQDNLITSVPHINSAIRNLINSALRKLINEQDLILPTVLDGELFSQSLSLQELSKRVSPTRSRHPEYEQVQYWIFDVADKAPAFARKHRLENLEYFNPLVHVPSTRSVSIAHAIDIYDAYVREGFEGIVVRHPDAPYVAMSRAYMMKMKPTLFGKGLIVGYTEEESILGEYKNALGAFICRNNDGDTFRVGTGFTRTERESFWDRRNALLGRHLEYAYGGLTDSGIPYFTRFVHIV